MDSVLATKGVTSSPRLPDYSVKDDDRYHMEQYGTFSMDSIHGRLFELQVYAESLKVHMFVYFAFVIVALLIWPIAALLAIPVAAVAGKDKDLQFFKIILVLASCIGYALWAGPAIMLAIGGGLGHLQKLLENKQINFLDLVDFFLSELVMLLTVVFAWHYHEMALDSDKYKEAAKKSWEEQRGEYGTIVSFTDAQYERLVECLPEEDFTKRPSQAGQLKHLGIEDVLKVIEQLPGWESDIPDVADHVSEQVGESTGFWSDLGAIAAEAKEKNLWPLDIWLTRTQFEPVHNIDMKPGLIAACNHTKDMVMMIINFMMMRKPAMAILLVLALIRTFLPRFWLWAVLGGEFWPSDPYGDAFRLVLYSTILKFVVSFTWLGLFYMIVIEYRRTLVQVVIVSAIFDADMRVKFSQFYLLSGMWFGLDAEQSEAVLAKLPLIDMAVSSNSAAFWRLREYCTLDRCNERIAMSLMLEIMIIWLALKFAATLTIMYVSESLPAILAVTLFDLLVFGGMALVALSVALKINTHMDEHKRCFVQAKYEVTMSYAAITDKTPDAQHKRHDLDIARRLLTEYLDITNSQEDRDAILLGMIVTPGKILSSLGTVAMMVYTLLRKMIQNGAVDAPPVVDEQIALAHLKHMSASLLELSKSLWHSRVAFVKGQRFMA